QLSDRGETDSAAGSVASGILLLQDVVIILAMLALPLVVNPAGGGVGAVLLRAGVSLGGLIVVTGLARLAMPWIVRFVFREKGRETMTLFWGGMAVVGG